MSEEKKVIGLKEEELEKVSGGNGTSLYCPECGLCISSAKVKLPGPKLCPTCNKFVYPIKK